MIKIFFVCHGNICRSPMAEFILKKLAKDTGREEEYTVSSAATSTEEIGNDLYPPAKGILRDKGIPFEKHRAHQVTAREMEENDLILVMDRNNRRNLERMFGNRWAEKIRYLMEYAGENRDVSDPWYTDDFETAYRDILAGCRGLLRETSEFPLFSVRIEQPGGVEKRLKYLPGTDTFAEKNETSLSWLRKVPEAYGWLEESGTPPCEHLDVIVMGEHGYQPGDREIVRIIGVYRRADGDHKLVGVTADRTEWDLDELPKKEREDLKRLYPLDGSGEGWTGRADAEKVIRDFFARKKRKIIVLVQHTESEHHVNGHNGGGYDWHLTERGRLQAHRIGEWLLGEDCGNAFEMIASPMNRAWETAEEIGKILEIPREADARLREISDGEGNGRDRTWWHFNRIPEPAEYDPDYRHFPSGESDRDLWDRIFPFYEDLMESDSERILIVAHGCSLSFLISMLTGHRFEDIRNCISMGPAGSVSKIVIEPDGRRIIRYINRQVP